MQIQIKTILLRGSVTNRVLYSIFIAIKKNVGDLEATKEKGNQSSISKLPQQEVKDWFYLSFPFKPPLSSVPQFLGNGSKCTKSPTLETWEGHAGSIHSHLNLSPDLCSVSNSKVSFQSHLLPHHCFRFLHLIPALLLITASPNLQLLSYKITRHMTAK